MSQTPNILLVRHSAGFEHSYLPDAEVALKAIGAREGWQVATTHLCRGINADNLAGLDLVAFATTGELPMDEGQKQALVDFVRGGKAFFGIHNATDTCYEWPEYGTLLGGYFNGHPWNQEIRVRVEDPDHPAVRHLGKSFTLPEEVYNFKDFDRSKTHVFMSLDNDSVDLAKGKRDDHDYALGWCHDYGKGRVIYSALGHHDDTWHEDWFCQHILGCMQWALRLES